MQKIGFFGGSFNPLTNAHIKLALKVIEDFKLDKIVFVPINQFYEKKDLAPEQDRLDMIKLVCDKFEKIEVTDIEIKIKKKLYATDAFELIDKQYEGNDIYYIMGSDNFKNLHKWKNYEDLIHKYKYIILLRNEDDIEENSNVSVLKDYKMDISSSLIREKIRNNLGINDFIPKEIEQYIYLKNLYK